MGKYPFSEQPKIWKYFIFKNMQSPWRNRLARSAVNRKVGGSSPPRDVLSFYSIYPIIYTYTDKHLTYIIDL